VEAAVVNAKAGDYRPSEHAKAMKVSPNQVFGLARKLQEEGRITKTAKGTYEMAQPGANAEAS
jgi:Mn-dependent DtxR family transcriptional regulator